VVPRRRLRSAPQHDRHAGENRDWSQSAGENISRWDPHNWLINIAKAYGQKHAPCLHAGECTPKRSATRGVRAETGVKQDLQAITANS
jgi:hypothetical protein